MELFYFFIFASCEPGKPKKNEKKNEVMMHSFRIMDTSVQSFELVRVSTRIQQGFIIFEQQQFILILIFVKVLLCSTYFCRRRDFLLVNIYHIRLTSIDRCANVHTNTDTHPHTQPHQPHTPTYKNLASCIIGKGILHTFIKNWFVSK